MLTKIVNSFAFNTLANMVSYVCGRYWWLVAAITALKIDYFVLNANSIKFDFGFSWWVFFATVAVCILTEILLDRFYFEEEEEEEIAEVNSNSN